VLVARRQQEVLPAITVNIQNGHGRRPVGGGEPASWAISAYVPSPRASWSVLRGTSGVNPGS
jgi:hypothetical protein